MPPLLAELPALASTLTPDVPRTPPVPALPDTLAPVPPLVPGSAAALTLAPVAAEPPVPTSPDTEALTPGSLPVLAATSTLRPFVPVAVPGAEAVALTFTAGLLELAAPVSALTVAAALRPPSDVVLGFAETFKVAPAESVTPPGVCGPSSAPDVSALALTVMPLLPVGSPTTAEEAFAPLGVVAIPLTCSVGALGRLVEGRFVAGSTDTARCLHQE